MALGAWVAMQGVNTGLMLAAFAIAAGLYAYRAWLKHRAEIIKSVPEKDKIEAIATTAEQLRVDIKGLPKAKQAEVVLLEIEHRTRRETAKYRVFLAVAILLALVAVVDLLRPPSQQPIVPPPRPLPSPPPDPVPLKESYEKLIARALAALRKAFDGEVNTNKFLSLQEETDLSNFRTLTSQAQSIAKQIADITKADPPCEAEYLFQVDQFIRGGLNRGAGDNPKQEIFFRAVIDGMGKLKSRIDIHNSTCDHFDYGGIYRYSGRAHYFISSMLDDRAGRVRPQPPSDSGRVEWEESKSDLATAYSIAPLYPDNVTWYMWALQGVLAGERTPLDFEKSKVVCSTFLTAQITKEYSDVSSWIERSRPGLRVAGEC